MLKKIPLMLLCCGLWACDRTEELPEGWEKDHCEGAAAGIYEFEMGETRYDLGTRRVLMDTTYQSRIEIARKGDTVFFLGTSTERFLYSHVDLVCNFVHTSIDSSYLQYQSYSASGKFYHFTDSTYSKFDFNGIRPVID